LLSFKDFVIKKRSNIKGGWGGGGGCQSRQSAVIWGRGLAKSSHNFNRVTVPPALFTVYGWEGVGWLKTSCWGRGLAEYLRVGIGGLKLQKNVICYSNVPLHWACGKERSLL